MPDQDVKQARPSWFTVRIGKIVVVMVFVLVAAVLLIRRGRATPSAAGTARPLAPAVGLASTHASSFAQPRGFVAQNPPEVAIKAAREVLEKLETDPNNFDLLAQAGNIYMHSRVFPGAVEYYQKALRIKEDSKVRNDYANALFYSGEVDRALQQYEIVLKRDPTNASALFNRGMVRWRGKHDPKGAVESWNLLLKTNPNDARRDAVEALIAQAKRHASQPQ